MGRGSVLTETKNVYGPLQSFLGEKKKKKLRRILYCYSHFLSSQVTGMISSYCSNCVQVGFSVVFHCFKSSLILFFLTLNICRKQI